MFAYKLIVNYFGRTSGDNNDDQTALSPTTMTGEDIMPKTLEEIDAVIATLHEQSNKLREKKIQEKIELMKKKDDAVDLTAVDKAKADNHNKLVKKHYDLFRGHMDNLMKEVKSEVLGSALIYENTVLNRSDNKDLIHGQMMEKLKLTVDAYSRYVTDFAKLYDDATTEVDKHSKAVKALKKAPSVEYNNKMNEIDKIYNGLNADLETRLQILYNSKRELKDKAADVTRHDNPSGDGRSDTPSPVSDHELSDDSEKEKTSVEKNENEKTCQPREGTAAGSTHTDDTLQVEEESSTDGQNLDDNKPEENTTISSNTSAAAGKSTKSC